MDRNWFGVLLVHLFLGVTLGQPARGGLDISLQNLRAEKRAALREAAAEAKQADQPALFGLLVIPVDFADWRLPSDWEPSTQLGPRLFPEVGETLGNYFRIASGNRLDLQIFLAPLVRLPGQRLDYSDRYFQGNQRTRQLATDALTAVSALGLDFRQLDMEGPDRQPGSADDDGEVDGVLILHAAPGLENDPSDGLIEALQFYLTVPVVDRGVVARSYAVASQESGIGIWAHEVGHLLGLNDRYDLDRSVSGDNAVARGGLGIFSLMAAGAWGRGDGTGAALLDAYSAAQLGWCDILPLRGGDEPDTLRANWAGRQAWRIWTHGLAGPEYFLLERKSFISLAQRGLFKISEGS